MMRFKIDLTDAGMGIKRFTSHRRTPTAINLVKRMDSRGFEAAI
jgi:hypothetical protein